MKTIILKPIATLGKYLMLMGRTFSRPERMRMYFKQYVNEMVQLGINSIVPCRHRLSLKAGNAVYHML